MVAYLCEKNYKLEFLHLKYNREMKNDLKQVFELVPEAIFVYNPKSYEILMSNTEFLKLV